MYVCVEMYVYMYVCMKKNKKHYFSLKFEKIINLTLTNVDVESDIVIVAF